MLPIYRAKIGGGLQRKPPEKKAQRKAHKIVFTDFDKIFIIHFQILLLLKVITL